MPARLVAVSYDVLDPPAMGAFWARLLYREAIPSANGSVLLPGDDTQLGLRFAPVSSVPAGIHRMHLHLTSTEGRAQEQLVARALDLGARHLDVGQRPEEGHVVLADVEGYEFCVIEPRNAYLEGCGPLGELACDGTRAVGVFWRDALDWPLVWDQDEETAIQSPAGGTKVAWGGPPVPAKTGRSPQRFELAPVAADAGAEIDRLLALGARRLGSTPSGAVELADPDGNEFCVVPGPV